VNSTGIYASDIAFTGTVKALQARKGSRRAYARMEEQGSWETTITSELAAFIAAQTSVFLATANAEGQPYIQHRGGPPGFLRVVDDRTIAFVDFTGNRQFITSGNLLDNPKAYLFLIDYPRRRRIKIWGTARVIENDSDLTARLMPADYTAKPEQVMLFTVSAWDANCPQHIPQRFEATDVEAALAERDRRIEDLEKENSKLKAQLRSMGGSAGMVLQPPGDMVPRL
jgi:predicted pyridoxine 5'-phosphate oxidase superfamily flavin-nucleotide-binding protein